MCADEVASYANLCTTATSGRILGNLMGSRLDQLFAWIAPGYEGFETLLSAAVFGFNIPLVGHDLDFISEIKPVAQTVVDELGLPTYLKRFKKAKDPEDHIEIRRLGKARRIANLWAYILRDADGDEWLVRSEGLYLGKDVPLMTTVGQHAAEMMAEAQEAMRGRGLEWRLVRFDLAEHTIFDRLEPKAEKGEREAMVVALKERIRGDN